MLNGSTQMTFDRNNPRFASLASGEALFRVHHDKARPFTLELGNNRIQDVGTVFNVVRDSSQVRVAVAEGKVVYSTQAQAVPLSAGQALSAQSDSPILRVTSTPVGSVGAWQIGRLVYSGERLSQVAADLGRSLGVHIVVSPTIADRPFSGAIVLDGAGSQQLERLKLALNVDLEAGPTGWTMKPVDDGGR
jgi:transmembrane sensor